jgi:sporulation protein YlmC with PRC-barrel domain
MRAEISTLFGLNVYTEKGIYVGKVNDVVIEVNDRKATGLAITKLNPHLFDVSSKGVIIPYRWVTAVGDIILMRQVADQFKKPEEIGEYSLPEEEEE